MQSLITQFPVNEAGMVDQFLGTAWDVVYNVYLKLPELTELNGQINNIPQMAQDAVDAAMVPAMEQIDAAVEEAKGWAEQAEAAVGKINTFYPFTYDVNQPVYDVVLISGDEDANTTGLALWVQGAIEYDFTIISSTQFVINSTDYPDGTGMGILINGRFDSIVQNFDDLLAAQELAFQVEQAQRDVEFNQYLTAFGYIFKGDYGPTPITISNPLDVIKHEGRIWGPLPSVPLPFATVNDWSVDLAKFTIVGEPTLRRELADPAGPGLLGYDDEEIYPDATLGKRIKEFIAGLANSTAFLVDAGVVQYATEGQPRTQQDKNAATLSVFDFLTPNERNNVSGNVGTINLTAKFNAALVYAASHGGVIEVDAGTWILDQFIWPAGLQRVIGKGAKHGVKIKHSAGSPGQLFRANDTRITNFTMENIYLEGHAGVGETCGLDVTWFSYGNFFDVRARLFREDGLYGFGEVDIGAGINKQVSNLGFFGCAFNNNLRDGARFIGISAQRYENTALTFVSCEFAGNAGIDFNGDVCESARLIGCTLQGVTASRNLYLNSRYCEVTGYMEGIPKGVLLGPQAFGCKVEVRSAYPSWNTFVDNSTAQNNHLSVMGEVDAEVHLFSNPQFTNWLTTLPSGLALLGTPGITSVADTRSLFDADVQLTITATLQGLTLSLTASSADVAGKWVTLVIDADTSGVADNLNTRVYAVDGTTLNTTTGQFAVEPLPKTASGMYRKLFYDVKFPDVIAGTATVRWYIGYDGVGAGSNVVKLRSLHLLLGQTRKMAMFAGDTSRPISATAAQLGGAGTLGNGINIHRKFAGKQVYDSTNGKLRYAVGATAASVWRATDGSGDLTPAA